MGTGGLPNGTFKDTSTWKPITKYLEDGAINYPDKAMFKIGNPEGEIIETYSYKETNEKAKLCEEHYWATHSKKHHDRQFD